MAERRGPRTAIRYRSAGGVTPPLPICSPLFGTRAQGHRVTDSTHVPTKTPPGATGGVEVNLHARQMYFASSASASRSKSCTSQNRTLFSGRRCKFSDRVWRPEFKKAHRRPYYDCRRFFCARIPVLWRLCVGDLRVCRVPSYPVRQPAHSCHPNSFGDEPWQFLLKKELHPCTP